MSESFQKLFPKAYFSRLLEEGLRSDGRSLLEERVCRVLPNVISTADASSICTIGRTNVLCGMMYEVGQSDDDLGRVEINLLEAGGGLVSEQRRVRLEEAIKRIIPHLVDHSELKIRSNLVWVLKATFLCLDDDGSLLDAMILALQNCLEQVRLPSDLIFQHTEVRIKSFNVFKQIQVNRVKPLTFCISHHGAGFIVDPTVKEESVLNSGFTVVVRESTGSVVSLLKTGSAGFLNNEVLKACCACSRNRVVLTV